MSRAGGRQSPGMRHQLDTAVDATRGGGTVTTPEVSVIVPGFRGRATIAACLDSVRRAAAGWRYEIIVVESSGDGAADLVRRRFPEIRVIEPPTPLSAGAARNEGFRHAHGRYLLCVDQDCLVPSDWIARLVELLNRDGVGAAGGSIAVANPKNIAGWCVYFLEFCTHFPSRGRIRDNNFLIGANSGWRPEAIRHQAFPDQTLGEDLLATEAIRHNGFRVLYDPSLTVRHHNRTGWGECLRYCRLMGRMAALSQARLGGRGIRVLRRMPALSMGIPLLILPWIAWRLRRAPPGYLPAFVALLPCCLVGHVLWANAFRAALHQQRAPRHSVVGSAR